MNDLNGLCVVEDLLDSLTRDNHFPELSTGLKFSGSIFISPLKYLLGAFQVPSLGIDISYHGVDLPCVRIVIL